MGSADPPREGEVLHVFCDPTVEQPVGGAVVGGNPTAVVLDADDMTDAAMQAFARSYGHECGFVRSAPAGSDVDHDVRFWVPEHEMSMCGHATVGIAWLLSERGLLPAGGMRVSTPSGAVRARVHDGEGSVEQPPATVDPLPAEAVTAVLDVLGVGPEDLDDRRPVCNATTSRTKTLVPLADPERLDRLRPDLDRVAAACDAAGSTGLYPFAVSHAADRVVDARQFPRSSGYPEDPATGVAAAALAFALREDGFADDAAEPAVTIRQGRAMGCPSSMTARFEDSSIWIGGLVRRSR